MCSKRLVRAGILLVMVCISAASCRGRHPSSAGGQISPDMEFTAEISSEVISQYTSQVISGESPILFSFVREVVSSENTGSVVSGCSIEPKVSGRFLWTDSRTVSFVPEKPLERGTQYILYSRRNQRRSGGFYRGNAFFVFSD